MNTEIVDLRSREILDSRGVPTIEIDVLLADDSIGRASVPSGASTGKMEAYELRDEDPKRYFGKGVLRSVDHVNTTIKKALLSCDSRQQSFIDQLLSNLDNTNNKSNLGANTILGVSLAVAKATAVSFKMPLYQYLGGMQAATMPVPMINVINGGVHADNMIDFQEFMIIPHGALSFKEALRISAEVFHNLRNILRTKNYHTNVGDEGGFAPNLKNAEEALGILIEAIEISGYSMHTDFSLGIDVAASTMYHPS